MGLSHAMPRLQWTRPVKRHTSHHPNAWRSARLGKAVVPWFSFTSPKSGQRHQWLALCQSSSHSSPMFPLVSVTRSTNIKQQKSKVSFVMDKQSMTKWSSVFWSQNAWFNPQLLIICKRNESIAMHHGHCLRRASMVEDLMCNYHWLLTVTPFNIYDTKTHHDQLRYSHKITFIFVLIGPAVSHLNLEKGQPIARKTKHVFSQESCNAFRIGSFGSLYNI